MMWIKAISFLLLLVQLILYKSSQPIADLGRLSLILSMLTSLDKPQMLHPPSMRALVTFQGPTQKEKILNIFFSAKPRPEIPHVWS